MDSKNARKITVVGTGVIGVGWAVRFLAAGFDVVATDPSPGAKHRLREMVARNLKRVDVPTQVGTLAFESDLAKAVAGTVLVQESAPEDESFKIGLLAELDHLCDPDCIIASSTSALLPSALQSAMARPERFIVGHPFNPVYLVPLVEIVPGSRTSAKVVERARRLYAETGMHPIVLRKEVHGFLGNRLQDALWREAMWAVHDGIASTEEIDTAVTHALGIRWALFGPYMVLNLAGGAGGIRHTLHHFGPSNDLPTTRLKAPELTASLQEAIIVGCESQMGSHSNADLEERRDGFLRELAELRAKYAI